MSSEALHHSLLTSSLRGNFIISVRAVIWNHKKRIIRWSEMKLDRLKQQPCLLLQPLNAPRCTSTGGPSYLGSETSRCEKKRKKPDWHLFKCRGRFAAPLASGRTNHFFRPGPASTLQHLSQHILIIILRFLTHAFTTFTSHHINPLKLFCCWEGKTFVCASET